MVKTQPLPFKCWQCGKRVRTNQGLKTHGTRMGHQVRPPEPTRRTSRKSGVMPGEDQDGQGRRKPRERRVTIGRASSEASSQSRAERPSGTADSSEDSTSSSSSSSSDARSESRAEHPPAGSSEEPLSSSSRNQDNQVTGAFTCEVCEEVFEEEVT